MLKRLFTSNTRIKLLTLFLLNPEEEFFIRELTRKLDEQINSIRRELDNLKKLGLLRSKAKNRKKYYMVNKNFVAFHDLRNIIIKVMSGKDELVKKIMQFGEVDFLALLGMFVEKPSPVDLLLVGDLDKKFKESEVVNPKVLLERKLIRRIKGKTPKVKILGRGELTKKLTIENCELSESAKKKIEKSKSKII